MEGTQRKREKGGTKLGVASGARRPGCGDRCLGIGALAGRETGQEAGQPPRELAPLELRDAVELETAPERARRPELEHLSKTRRDPLGIARRRQESAPRGLHEVCGIPRGEAPEDRFSG